MKRAMLRLTSLALVSGALLVGCGPLARHPVWTPLRVMTYNIRSGNGDLARTAAAIRDQSPDMVALQEVDVHWSPRSAFADQATELGERLGMAVRFARIYRLQPLGDSAPPREFGVALLSRYPIVRFVDDSLTRLSTQDPNPVPTRMPGLLDAVIDVNGRQVRVLNTHLDYRADPHVRELQVAEMLGYLRAEEIPTILFGDLNAEPTASEVQPLLHALHDSWMNSSDPGPTYPADAPTKRIDYILVSSQFLVRSTRVPATLASDHRPVVADLILR